MKELIKKIGQQLDMNIMPEVFNCGIVRPSDATAQKSLWAKEKNDEKRGQDRSATAAWTGPARGKGTAGGARATGETPPFLCSDFEALYEGELPAIAAAYPGTQVWKQQDGLWLLSESVLVSGLTQKAVFLTGIPFSRAFTARGWGFWAGPPWDQLQWIGPRHTNFPDGSICAFDPSDEVWELGDPIINLLDLYTMWAFRHLHLQLLGRWPGRQVAKHVYERVTEFREGEYCGCENGDRLYADCCRERDLGTDLQAEFMFYFRETCGVRRPPKSVVDFVRNQQLLPDLLPSAYSIVAPASRWSPPRR